MNRIVGVCVAILPLAFAVGCAARPVSLMGASAIVTNADQRAIIEVQQIPDSKPGRVRPVYLHCAEPSPDIAIAISKGFNLGTSVSVSGLPQGVEPKLALAISRANAEAVAQLTERLATIQLLRDGLYRACEAYANGAISDTIYAIMLSRIDKMMVTMLIGELTAGAFGRRLAVLGTEAELSPSALSDDANKPGGATDIKNEPKPKPTDGTVEPKPQGREVTAKPGEQESKAASKPPQGSKPGGTSPPRSGQGAARASTVSATGELAVTHSADIAKQLAEMQRKYIENLNFDAVEVACVAALDQGVTSPELAEALVKYTPVRMAADEGLRKQAPMALMESARQAGLSALAGYCLTGLLPSIQEKKAELVKQYIDRATAQHLREDEHADLEKLATDIGKHLESIKKVLGAYSALSSGGSGGGRSENQTPPKDDE